MTRAPHPWTAPQPYWPDAARPASEARESASLLNCGRTGDPSSVRPALSGTVAALYVQTGGCYFDVDGVDPWDEPRDARQYAGPHPVVAHPPCARWGRYWGGAPKTWPRLKKGDDGGCFKAALDAVRRYGGILEHPEASHAWAHFGLNKPPRSGGWITADFYGGWTCCVEQGWYGHRARKATWLFACHVDLPSLNWGKAPGDFIRLDEGFHSAEERRRAVKTGVCQRLPKKERAATPIEFRDLLIGIARTARVPNTIGGFPVRAPAAVERAGAFLPRRPLTKCPSILSLFFWLDARS